MRIVLRGQVRGGKNNMGVTRSGIHYPKPEFVKWRADMMAQIMAQRPAGFKAIDNANWSWIFAYTPGDHRRRDIPAILDAVYHTMERTNIITDDYFIQQVHFSTLPVSKENASIVIDFVETKENK